MSAGVVVELIEDTPTPREKFQQDSYMSDEIIDREYRQYLDRFQPWRWIAKSAGNNEPLAKSTESYFNEDDCRHAIGLLFGSATPARLTVEYRDGRVKSEVLR
jgi:uncharacterized protein YegP (UPF0339 family)